MACEAAATAGLLSTTFFEKTQPALGLRLRRAHCKTAPDAEIAWARSSCVRTRTALTGGGRWS